MNFLIYLLLLTLCNCIHYVSSYVTNIYDGFTPFYVVQMPDTNSTQAAILWIEPQIASTAGIVLEANDHVIENDNLIANKYSLANYIMVYIDICSGYAKVSKSSKCPKSDVEEAKVISSIYKSISQVQGKYVYIGGHRLGITSQLAVAEALLHYNYNILGVMMFDSHFQQFNSLQISEYGKSTYIQNIGMVETLLNTISMLWKDIKQSLDIGIEDSNYIETTVATNIKSHLDKILNIHDFEYRLLNPYYDRYSTSLKAFTNFGFPVLIEVGLSDKDEVNKMIGRSEWAKGIGWANIKWEDVYVGGEYYGKCKMTSCYIICVHINEYAGLVTNPIRAYYFFDIISTL